MENHVCIRVLSRAHRCQSVGTLDLSTLAKLHGFPNPTGGVACTFFPGFPPLWASDTCLPIFPAPPLILRTWVIGSSLPSTSSYLSDPLSGQPVLFGPSNLLDVGLAGRVGEGTTGRPSTDREKQQDHVTDLRRTCTCQGEPWPGWCKGGKCGLLCTGLTGRERTQGDGQEEKKKPAKMKLGQNNQFFYDEKVRQAYARTKVER